MQRRYRWVLLLLATQLACGTSSGSRARPAAGDPPPTAEPIRRARPPRRPEPSAAQLVQYSERREPCTERNPLRNAYFGDLHVHTGLSFDANTAGFYDGPETAYAFARGAPVGLPPRDKQGRPLSHVRLERPLDFAAVTEHSEFLGEVLQCTTVGSPVYETRACRRLRRGGFIATGQLAHRGMENAGTADARDPRICPPGLGNCERSLRSAWKRIQDAAEVAYDRSSLCTFTSFVGFEWTGTVQVSNLHRNVIFRNARVPELPTSAIGSPTPRALWDWLDASCHDELGCDVLAIPHNSNLSNGKMFTPGYPGVESREELARIAAQRGRLEPLLEIFQHKGNSECFNGFTGMAGEPDELCEIEQLRRTEDVPRSRGTRIVRRALDLPKEVHECNGDSTEMRGGLVGRGCVSPYDFARTILTGGLAEQLKLGVNPYRLGFIASTDTHLATPGATDEASWQGHLGYETQLAERLDTAVYTGRLEANPGGLAGVWAVENSRDALFEAMLRRETFGTSGPRIVPRFFGGFGLAKDLCQRPDLVSAADAHGVPMGGRLRADPWAATGAPLRFVVYAEQDSAAGARGLDKLQIIKGWVDAEGVPHHEVFDVAQSARSTDVDLGTCEPLGRAAPTLCGVFEDPAYDPTRTAVYYARVVQAPTCRWSWAQCVALPPGERPSECENDAPKRIHELAWTSPIWVEPTEAPSP